MSITVDDGTLITKDPGDTKVFTFDWDADNLAVGVAIASQVTTVTALEPSSSDTALTLTQSGTGLGIVGSSRKVAIKLAAGTEGQKYRVTCAITTNETPAQVKERSFYVLVEQL